MYAFRPALRALASLAFLTTLLGGLATLGARPASAQQSGPRRFAVLIGISNYLNDGITDLKCADNDAQALGKTLKELGYEVRVLTSQDGGMPVTRKRILDTVQEVGTQSQIGDIFLFMYSGHGMQVGMGSAAESFLITQDCDPATPAKIKATALSSRDLDTAIGNLRASKRLVILDACRSELGKAVQPNSPNGVSAKDLVIKPRAEDPTNVSIVGFACEEGQKSYEYLPEGRGYFSYLFERELRAPLSSKDVAPGQPVKWSTIFTTVSMELPKLTQRDVREAQTPMQKSYGRALDVDLYVKPIPPAPTLADIPAKDKFALVISTDGYSTLPAIPGAVADGDAFATFLKEKLKFPADQVVTLKADKGLIRGAAFARLSSFVERLSSESVVVLFYVGHGKRAAGQDWLLLPYADDTIADSHLRAFHVPLDERLFKPLADKKVRQVLGFLDMSREIKAGEAGVGFDPARRMPEGTKFSLVYSCTGSEPGRDYRGDEKRSAFTHFLLTALKGEKGADDKGRVTLASLGKLLKTQVSEYVQKEYQGSSQTPGLVDQTEGLVLFTTTPEQPKPMAGGLSPAIPNPGTGTSVRVDQTRPTLAALPPLAAPFAPSGLKPKVAGLSGHTAPVSSLALDNGAQVLASASMKEVILWNPVDGKQILALSNLPGSISAATLSPDGTLLAVGLADGRIFLFQSPSGQLVGELKGHTNFIPANALVFSPDSKQLASGAWDRTVRLWNVATQKAAVFEGHTNTVSVLAFSPDGKTLASGSVDTTVRLYDTTTAGEVAVLQGHRDGVKALVFSPDGSLLASGSNDRTARLWDGWTGKFVKELAGATGPVALLAFSPDGASLAGASLLQVQVWSVKTDAPAVYFKEHRQSILSLAFGPDGKTVASGGEDRMLYLWDPATGTRISELGIADTVQALVFSRSGDLLAGALQSKMKVAVFRPAGR